MSESVVRVDLRQATLSESARLRESEDCSFIALDTPPPVRSLLRVGEGDELRAFEVGRVVEVVDEQESERGCYGKFIELERLEANQKVGSEHLSPGISNSGVPAPVVIMNTSDMMLGEAGEEGEAAAASEDAETGEGEASEAGEASDEADAGEDGEEGEGASDPSEGEAGEAGEADDDASSGESENDGADTPSESD